MGGSGQSYVGNSLINQRVHSLYSIMMPSEVEREALVMKGFIDNLKNNKPK